MSPITDPWFYAAAIPAVFLVGLSKGGLGGTMGMLGVPILTLVISPVQAAGLMLPILVVMDIIALIAYKGRADWKTISLLLPAALIGIGLGWAVAAYVNEAYVRLLVGLISIAFVADYLFKQRKKKTAGSHNYGKGLFWGTVTGVTSFVSHTGGPPYQMYVLPLRLEPTLYVGTSVLFFAALNMIKLVPYSLLGQFDSTNLWTSALLLPIAAVATLTGVQLVKRIKAETFYNLIFVFMAIIGVKLVFDGLSALSA